MDDVFVDPKLLVINKIIFRVNGGPWWWLSYPMDKGNN